MAVAKLTKTMIAEALPGNVERFIWDTEVRSFGVRISPSGRKMFVQQYRFNKRTRKLTLGPADVLPLSTARMIARENIVTTSHGIDPAEQRDNARNAMTVNELAEYFEAQHIAFNVKDSTAREYRRALKAYILPALGAKKVSAVARTDVQALHTKLKDKPTQANRTIEIVSKMFGLAEELGARAPNSNPRRGIKKYPETKRERFLSDAELRRIGEVLEEMASERVEMPSAIAAARLLMLTGCRLNEIMTLKWDYVRLRAGLIHLPDSKTGKKTVALSEVAVAVLRGIDQVDGNPWVITGKIEGARLTDLQPFWQRVRARAGLNGVRIHDLRHTFASVAAASGMSLHMIGKLLGHASTQTTARYAHLATGTVQQAANDVAGSIAASMSAGLR